jgi:hypothetical protein
MVFCDEKYPKAFVGPFRAVARRIFPDSTATAKAAPRLEVILEEIYHAFGAAGVDCLQFMKKTQPNPYHQPLAGFSAAG